ncbi:hypothetical protein [Xanthobacter agilis]|uniref:hypothetical protein n=1 Tax=Xanthobacter agilis TaxID=47492 RepID=UPI0037299D99
MVKVLVGAKGADGDYDMKLHRPTDGQPGADGPAITIQNLGDLGGGKSFTSPLVELMSKGGMGGAHYKTRRQMSFAGSGGKGGNVTFVQNGTINVARTNQAASGVPLISLKSVGGQPALLGWSGGDAGTVTFRALKSIGIEGDNFSIIRLTSQGRPGRTNRNGATAGISGRAIVEIGSGATLSTNGKLAPAIIAEARGGGGDQDSEGKAGGNAWTGTGENASVRFTNNGTVITRGDQSIAVLLESVGGTGGNATAWASRWGKGGTGGSGGSILGTQRGTIATEGAFSFGIAAQSVGGTGGRGANGALRGGAGGNAGRGGTVTLVNSGKVTTKGESATALMAQSIGGGRAIEAFSVQTTKKTEAPGGGQGGSAWFPFFAKGGVGGTGGDGGEVRVRNDGTIRTQGASAKGLFAQSIGGSGGAGGDAAAAGLFFSMALGGTGGGGGDGGAVYVEKSTNTTSSITTSGETAGAIFAQSVGGGGGAGGSAWSGALGNAVSLSVAVGGSGGKGGKGGTVEVDNLSNLVTHGKAAAGVEAQSVGGGGGAAGKASSYAIAAAVPGADVESIALALAVGGKGGDGGGGGAVAVYNAASISTDGRDAVGIDARSIGGGGGSGGAAASHALAAPTGPNVALSVSSSVGGAGGKGGDGGTVNVVNKVGGKVVTWGTAAAGVRAVSAGGGGGVGGGAESISDLLGYYKTIAGSFSIGGKGGGGGTGGAVTVENEGGIETWGQFSNGITALSVGGGGGEGGTADTAASAGLSTGHKWDKEFGEVIKTLPLADAVTFNATIGGAGGDGGSGGTVMVTNTGRVHTGGTNATAIQAVSVGGGGGTGGGFQGGGEGDQAANLKLGGSGGKGGNGGDVSVKNTQKASVETVLSGSHGIVAVSVGGGGGIGGAFTGKRESAAPNFPTSGKAEDIRNYIVTITGEVLKSNKVGKELAGKNIPNVFGKDSSVQKVSGYVKSVMATAKSINRNDPGEFLTFRNGIGAVATAAQIALSTKLKDWAKENLKKNNKEAWDFPSVSLNYTNGGSGGGGGGGGEVDVTNSGSILTHGDLSYAILAQSVGGGGGAGGGAYANGNNVFNLNITNGGTGGGGGNGGHVKVTNDGTIATAGSVSYGILAQSVGGGGGIAGGAVQQNTISLSANINMGASGGKSGNGGRVEIGNTGKITTTGDEAHAIVAQSVGGGGGSYFLDRSASLKSAAVPKELQEALAAVNDFVGTVTGKSEAIASLDYVVDGSNAILPTPSLNVKFGGKGSSGGNGGDVEVKNSGAIVTSGLGAFGIFAQSVGGGGGMGSSGKGDALISANVQFGGSGGVAGQGGGVKVKLGNDSSISTSGDGAHAIFAQSVGGGGGYGGTGRFSAFQLVFSPSGSGGSSGAGGHVEIETESNTARTNITTSGGRAHGIFAQSLGGGGGFVSNLNGKVLPEKTGTDARSNVRGEGGPIDIHVAGTISAVGMDSYGIFAQSGQQKADGTLANVREASGVVDISYSGTLTGGAGSGAAIRSDTANDTTITLKDADTVLSALSGTAITAAFGTTKIVNDGTVIGDIRVYNGEFMNRAGALYQSRPDGDIRLPGKGFFNAGSFDIGGVGTISTATLTGSYQGQRGSKLLVDISPAAGTSGRNADQLVTTQGAHFESGTFVQPNAITWLLPGTYTFLKATAGGISGDAPTVTGVNEVAVPITWSIETKRTSDSGGAEMSLTPKADFAHAKGVTLTEDQRAMADNLQGAWNAASSEQAKMFAQFLSIKSAQDYANALNGLSADDNADQASTSVVETRAGLKAAMSCPSFVDDTTLIHEGDCLWARVIGGRATMSASSFDDGFTQNTMTYRIGGQHEFMENWFLGFSAGVTQGWMTESGGGSSSSSNTFGGAVALKYQTGPWLFALSAALGNTWQDNFRNVVIGTSSATAQSNSQVLNAGLKLRGAYEFTFTNWYLRSYLDVDTLYIDQPAYAENGAPGVNLDVSSAQKTLFAFNPSLELGGRVDLEQGYWLRPYATVGYTLLSSDTFATTSRFQDGPISLGTFETATSLPNNLVDLGLGLQIASGEGLDLTAEYQAQIASDYLAQFGSLKLAVRF